MIGFRTFNQYFFSAGKSNFISFSSQWRFIPARYFITFEPANKGFERERGRSLAGFFRQSTTEFAYSSGKIFPRLRLGGPL
jgi:hypothetical protein